MAKKVCLDFGHGGSDPGAVNGKRTEKADVLKMGLRVRDLLVAQGIDRGADAIKTVAQTAVATIGTSAVIGAVNWLMVGSAALLARILSLLTSVAGLPEVEKTE